MAKTTPFLFLLVPVLLLLSAASSEARVPKGRTFRSVNEGESGQYPLEYMADYRFVSAPNSINNMFYLVWFNTTPYQFFLGLRMGITRDESPFRIVWEANRGRPVGENATLTFSSDGNLVLAEADGRAVWSTGTANKGVVDFQITETGNIILPDKNGRPLWQSFDHPTDTLLVGQSLRSTGPTRLVSRNSRTDDSDGVYSLVLEPKEINLYLSTPTKRYRYASFYQPSTSDGVMTDATFDVRPYNNAYDLVVSTNVEAGPQLAHVTFNATFSILRLEMDGNLAVYSYYDPEIYRQWKKTYSFFVDGGDYPNQPLCSLPSKCGGLGLCEDGMCVGCPTAKGTLGWSRSCAPAASSCEGSGGVGYYYRVVGVEQFIPVWNEGEGVKVKVEECRRRCTGDCRCNGFFYWEESSTCWLAPVLGTLRKVDNTSHVAYIKYSKA